MRREQGVGWIATLVVALMVAGGIAVATLL
jgi:hypothetical protein